MIAAGAGKISNTHGVNNYLVQRFRKSFEKTEFDLFSHVATGEMRKVETQHQ